MKPKTLILFLFKFLFLSSFLFLSGVYPDIVGGEARGGCVFSQPRPVYQEWVARYPGPFNDLYGPFLSVDKDGNSYVAGTHVLNDSINILCVKYNSSGVQQWATLYKYPGYGLFSPSGLAIDSSGNAYVTSSYAIDVFNPPNILTVKFSNSDGSFQWVRTYSGQIQSEPSDIKIDRLNNIYVVGYADYSLLCLKYNTNGDSLWVRQYNTPQAKNWAFACTLDDSLNIIMTGRSIYYVDTMLTVKYSTYGIFRWVRTFRYANSPQTNGTKIVADQYGNIYIGGRTRVPTYWEYLTVKYDRNGIKQWASIFDGPGNGDNVLNGMVLDKINNFLFVTGYASINNIAMATTIKYDVQTGDSIWVRNDTGTFGYAGANDIKIDTAGNCYITGATRNANSSIMDILTFKISTLGNQIWQVTYNGPYNGWDNGYFLGLDNTNNIYILGTSQSGFQLTDYVVIKYSQLSAIKPLAKEIPKIFKLAQNFPNPFNPNTKILFSIPKKSFIHLKIYDVLGRIKEIPINEQLYPSSYEITIDGSRYSSGVYFYQLVANDIIIDTKKFVVLK